MIAANGDFCSAEQLLSPIIIDLDGDGVETVIVNNGVMFDLNANGFAEQTGWVKADDGLLVLDRNSDGTINNGTELFGDYTVLQNGNNASSGFQALAELDANSDGKVDVYDSAFTQLRVWQDGNCNGQVDTGELHTLAELNITALNTGYTAANSTDAQGNVLTQLGSYQKSDSTTGEMSDYKFKTNQMNTYATEWLTVSPDIAALPDINGYGNVYSLHQAMVRDTTGTLRGLVEDFIAEPDPTVRSSILDQILYKWTGNESVATDSRGPYVNAQELAVLESLMGTEWYKFEIANNLIPGGQAGDVLGKVYDNVKEGMYVELMRQSHLREIYDLVTFETDVANQCIRANISAAQTALETLLTTNPTLGKVQTVEFFRLMDSLGAVCVIENLATAQENISILYPEMEEDKYTAIGKCIVGTDGNDLLQANSELINVVGKAGDDSIYGNNSQLFNDVLCGGAGNDNIYGSGGDDTLIGGAGNDYLSGGTGNDTYVYGAGSGNDVILNGETNNSDSQDTVKLSGSLTPDMVEFGYDVARNGNARYWDDIQLKIKATGETLQIVNWLIDESYQIEKFVFSNGSVITAADINDTIRLIGTDSAETLFGSGAFGDRIYGNGGNDNVYGNGGNDELHGGDGDDDLFGGNGNDTINGDSGYDILNGQDGDDVLDGGADYDRLYGDGGNDTYLFGIGSGNDFISDYAMDWATTEDIVQMGAGLTQDSFDYYQIKDGWQFYSNIVMKVKATGDTLTLLSWFLTADDQYKINKIIFTDGSELTAAQISDLAAIKGTEEADSISGTLNHGDKIYGYGGNDSLYGSNGNDQIFGGTGNDTIKGENDDDALYGEEGDDTIEGNAGNDVLYGGSGNDSLDGGLGADSMSGGQDDDLYTVDDAGDIVVENVNEGLDLVKSSIGYSLGANVENLTLTGTANIDGTGNELDNIMTGNSGANALAGAAGNDTYIVDNTGDVVTENVGEGIDTVKSSISFTLGANVENLTLTGYSAINGTGNELDNIILGNIAANIMTGGLGNDTYGVDSSKDVVVENANEGTDTVQASISYTLGNNLENLTLVGTNNINATGNSLDNLLAGNSGNNILDGGLGADTMAGGAGNDTYVVDNAGDVITETANAGTDLIQAGVSYTIADNVENLTLTGTAAINGTGNELDNVIAGNSGINILSGAAGNDILNGGAGADTMAGNTGDDTYIVDNVGDIVTENVEEGIDLVQASVTYSLSANVENLTLTGSSAINGTGTVMNNVITGNGYNNILDGGAGSDTLIGGAGNDTYGVDDAGDVVVENANEGIDTVQSSISYTLGSNFENLTLMGTAAINGTGNDLDNIILGNSADNQMVGGLGNDTYGVDNAGDVVVENANEGIDTVQSSISYTLGVNFENLTLVGPAAINGVGNDLDNIILGNSANNQMTGGLGNDTYGVHNTGDVIVENANEGVDTVRSSITYTLGANLENLILTGTSFINGTGNALNNSITGNNGYNTLNGELGADTMAGGAGNDIYVVDDVGDVVIENANEGTDIVQSSISYMLGANVENLTLTGTAAINATGNELANTLTGNSDINQLAGGLGDDTYVIDNLVDAVIENSGEGTDTVKSSISYTLGANLENLTLTGFSTINGIGNELDNVITGTLYANVLTGNLGNDTLNGGGGADTMLGGLGNDTYVVDNAGDVVTEYTDEGTDTVKSSISYLLGNNLENLTLTGFSSINGTGNSLDNVLIGNNYNNVLNGGAGNDWLRGGLGNDTYVWGTAAGNDTIESYEGTSGNGTDTLQFQNLQLASLEFSLSNNDLVCTITQTGESICLTNWNLGANYQVDTFQFSDQSLTAAQVSQRI
jgi:Ca2+-binding RTX toxin-like protein